MNWKKLALPGAVVSLLFILTHFLTRSCGSTPAIPRDPSSSAAPAVAALRPLDLNGSRQWVLIRGQSVTNPLLLYLAGGPGLSELAWLRLYNSGLERRFTVVNWDQRGAGKSAAALGKNDDLSLETVMTDTVALVEILRQEFGQERVVLAAHGAMTVPAMLLVRDRPDLFRAYVGIGQMVHPDESDRHLYRTALRKARKTGQTNALSQLERLGTPPYSGSNLIERYGELHRQVNTLFTDDYPPNIYRTNWIKDVISAPEYSSYDRRNYWPSYFRVFEQLYPRISRIDLSKEADTVRIPVLFVQGRHDRGVLEPLTRQYFDRLRAPWKKLVYFENSGNSPHFEEPEKFLTVLTREIAAPR